MLTKRSRRRNDTHRNPDGVLIAPRFHIERDQSTPPCVSARTTTRGGFERTRVRPGPWENESATRHAQTVLLAVNRCWLRIIGVAHTRAGEAVELMLRSKSPERARQRPRRRFSGPTPMSTHSNVICCLSRIPKLSCIAHVTPILSTAFKRHKQFCIHRSFPTGNCALGAGFFFF